MMLGVTVALNFTIAQLKLAINYDMKLEQFQRFRFVFLGYLIIPTFLLLLKCKRIHFFCYLLVATPPG
ncbi:hypothetical protein F444_16563 [Phytophthora nicotianae P1976]|uniref:Uncharacterized protein n=1 Tax=Phytophthora nicotianae P1976 TaxID=1317066 RepID=A0A080ZHS6_PHYNI|nr:hypothetical protein F444_16563 [Phytophthora nicotianae P1976]